MRYRRLVLPVAAILLLSGCLVYTTNPLYTEKDLTFEPKLLGAWMGEDGKTTWTLARSGSNAYQVTSSDDGDKSIARLVRLGKYRFLDCQDLKEGGAVEPLHCLVKISLEGDTLQVAAMNDEWLKEMISEHRTDIAHQPPGDDVTLTASTKELQAFVLKYAGDPKAFPLTTLRRKK